MDKYVAKESSNDIAPEFRSDGSEAIDTSGNDSGTETDASEENEDDRDESSDVAATENRSDDDESEVIAAVADVTADDGVKKMDVKKDDIIA